jgi:hypothetical protein
MAMPADDERVICEALAGVGMDRAVFVAAVARGCRCSGSDDRLLSQRWTSR